MTFKKRHFNNLINRAFGLSGADRKLVIAAAGLIVFGLVMLISASSVVAYNDHRDSLYFFKRQSLAISLGIVLFLAAANISKERLKKWSFALLMMNIALLVTVLILGLFFGVITNGSRAWIPIFGFNIQPSEFVKPIFLLYLANMFAAGGERQIAAKEKFVPFVIIFVLIAVLIGVQPDIGTLFIITLSGLVALIAAGMPWKYLFGLTGVGLLVLAAMISFWPHQQNRFRCLLSPDYSPSDKCYQLNQSLIAIGSGGLIGRGLGESRQKFLNLPEVQNDFIFSIVAEETGFLIGGLLILVYAFIFYRAYLVAKYSNDQFVKVLAVSLGGWLFLQAVLNIGGVIRMLPMTGVPLPFISYGGSAIMAGLVGLGLLVNLSRKV